jgi:ATP-binding cassette, subfamily B, bacterial
MAGSHHPVESRPDPETPRKPSFSSSRRRYGEFVREYRDGRLDQATEARSEGARDAEEKRSSRRRSFRRYVEWLRPYTPSVAVIAVLSLVGAGLQMLEPLFMRYIIDRVLLVGDMEPAQRLTRLHIAGALFLGVIVVHNLVGVIRDYRQRVLNEQVKLSLRTSLFERLVKLPLPKLWDMKTGGILSRLTGDVDTTSGLLQMAIVSPAISLVRLIIAIVILMTLNWRLALTAMAVIPGAMLASFVWARRVRPIYRSTRKDVEEIDGRVGETFSGIRVVRAFGREGYELLDYLRGRHLVMRKGFFAYRRELLLWTSWALLIGGVNVVIIWYGGYLNIAGNASVGDIMAFQWYTFLLLNPVWQIVNSFSELQRSLAATERVFEILEQDDDKPDRPDAIEAPELVDEIRFERVEFAYAQGTPVIHDFDVTIPGGSVVALVGRSGAGKSTITDLVARFHDPTKGRILVNGVDIRDYALSTYRDRFALVQQDVFLFDGTIRDNIAYGRRRVTEEEIEGAARRANAHDFIVGLPDGYDTLVGERGVKLSGGQQQRLAIARAILADPEILILDEATSNLDTESEQLIQAALTDLLQDRTTFVIAHRLSTVRRADVILLLDHGRIVEQGTHEELMERGGLYRDMVVRQSTVDVANVGEWLPVAAAPSTRSVAG